ncbi:N-acetylmuramoyl-L-alanine amidase [Tepidibacter hydrothermalis]|uniref:N-acetylmuramoyl-L-alanine amidase n=1 Tax=Tepidibacter hydrothermalis TaxID=3036126 RepID=A0ABY8EB25_9FIRM|nr:N-acetylmuramoyl-L-alanine amidase [Tepidibacter hydrothermalis]WFD10132.1 N-acetylmuramoyl-L-alanine amidase [Tepidibacter hydrothermalis]
MDRKFRNLIAYKVSKNIPQEFHIQAIMCQAIIERTNIFRSISDGDFKKEEFNIEDIYDKALEAVDNTHNLVIMFNDSPICAYYHICCGGSTENSEYLLNTKIDYLRGITCEECMKNKESENIVDVDLEELESIFKFKISQNLMNEYSINNMLKVLGKTNGNRVENILVFNEKVKGSVFSESLNLDSSRFGFRPIKIRFYTKGIGHGLGLCQYGANEKAKNNWNYEKILNHYYTNINLYKLDNFNLDLPLKNKKIFLDAGHGGEDCGYTNDLITEKEVSLKVTMKLKEKLEKSGASVYLSRSIDEYVCLDKRIKMIKKANPDFLLSIHLNKSKFEGVSGAEAIYYWGDTNGKLIGENILSNLKNNMNIKNRGAKEGRIYILKESGCNGVYCELGYISNPVESKLLEDDDVIDKMAENIVYSILEYYGNNILT